MFQRLNFVSILIYSCEINVFHFKQSNTRALVLLNRETEGKSENTSAKSAMIISVLPAKVPIFRSVERLLPPKIV